MVGKRWTQGPRAGIHQMLTEARWGAPNQPCGSLACRCLRQLPPLPAGARRCRRLRWPSWCLREAAGRGATGIVSKEGASPAAPRACREWAGEAVVPSAPSAPRQPLRWRLPLGPSSGPQEPPCASGLGGTRSRPRAAGPQLWPSTPATPGCAGAPTDTGALRHSCKRAAGRNRHLGVPVRTPERRCSPAAAPGRRLMWP